MCMSFLLETIDKLDYDYKIFFEYENAYPLVIMSKVNKVKEDTAEELAENGCHISFCKSSKTAWKY